MSRLQHATGSVHMNQTTCLVNVIALPPACARGRSSPTRSIHCAHSS